MNPIGICQFYCPSEPFVAPLQVWPPAAAAALPWRPIWLCSSTTEAPLPHSLPPAPLPLPPLPSDCRLTVEAKEHLFKAQSAQSVLLNWLEMVSF